MTRPIQFFACLLAMLCTGLAFAQDNSTSSPVAFVYVSSNPSGNSREIDAFAAASNGKLTPVSGSPFSANVQGMAVNGKYLFGTDGIYIYSFSIASDGGLKQVASINAQKFNGSNCGGPVALFLDHTGTTLYDEDFYGNLCANNTYQAFAIDRSTGVLSYLGASDPSVIFNVPLSFIGNNVYAYGSSSREFSSSIFGFRRSRGGTLTDMNLNPPLPRAKHGDFYVTYGAAADPTNHVAISVAPYTGSWQQDGPLQLATYTADNSGNLTTRSTFSNMPAAAIQYVTNIQMSPSGKLLAVGGTAGLQIFHFNGGDPITHYTARLTIDEVDQLFWDDNDHLYALSLTAGKLFVFTITPTKVSQAPGSPYSITSPRDIIVLPKT